MKALILRQDPKAACATSKTLIDKGFLILCVETLAVAHALIRVDTIDLLVMDEVFDGQMTHALALSGERRSPCLSAIMLTDRDRTATDDLYDLIPCLYALAGTQTAPDVLGKLAVSAVSNMAETVARVAARDVIDTQEAEADRSALRNEADVEPDFADAAIAAPEMEGRIADIERPMVHIKEALPPEVAAMLAAQPFYKQVDQFAGRHRDVA
ncbi:imidazoleglycerol-phosphate dehydratase [Yoonia sp.]|uniref:imidazoleglycerol-phosphate dehydratase n=1 Tax=Yoonia sp. TaxID=2212373 RepID=UPI0035C7FBA6